MASQSLAAAIEALHEHLSKSGVLAHDKIARWQTYRLRAELAVDLGDERAVATWRDQIARMDGDADMEARR